MPPFRGALDYFATQKKKDTAKVRIACDASIWCGKEMFGKLYGRLVSSLRGPRR